ncbi:MAG: ABC transporter permease subunit, partial [Anaerohalosphaera sp.]|nr:ABC transporter permease subunit [Anaerohalosphaera sp.]
KRTLDVLLTTPITCVQIVMGKVLSSFLQLVLLIGITLPLFSVIRVFGGVPWDHVVVFLCIILTTTCLFASISLFYSIHNKHTYRAVVLTLATAFLIFAAVPIVLNLLAYSTHWSWLAPAISVASMVNPFITFASIMQSMMSSDPQGTAAFPWAFHCGIVTLAFVALLALSVWRLKKVMPNLAAGNTPKTWNIKRLFGIRTKDKSDIIQARKTLEVSDDPIYWREVNRTEYGSLFGPRASIIVMIVLLVVIYFIAMVKGWLLTSEFHAVIVTVLAGAALLRIAILSAQSISAEKQARTLPILLMTPLEDADIIRKKRNAIFKKTSLYWYLIFGDVFVFSLLTVIHPAAIIGVLAAIVPAVLFIMGIGFYCGTRFRTTTGTMTATFAIPFVLWFFCPCFANFSPLMLIALSIASDGYGGLNGILFAMGVVPTIIYAVAGIIMLSMAKSSMRNNVFNVAG